MDSSSSSHLTLVDSHVHFYSCFDAERFLAAAFGNVAAQGAARGAAGAEGALLLAETAGGKWFESAVARADGEGDAPGRSVRFSRTDEEESVVVRGGRGETLYVVAGSQIVTRERLEVLALCTAAEFRDGEPVETVLDQVLRAGGLPVLPWGAGKWWGARGRIVTKLLETWQERGLRCADSGVRPLFWPRPPQFGANRLPGAALLRGSDPLPLPGEEERVGSFGSALPVSLSARTPAADLRRYLSEEAAAAVPYGKPAGILHFLSTQLRLRLGRCGKEGTAE
jgi:hypothetical protein